MKINSGTQKVLQDILEVDLESYLLRSFHYMEKLVGECRSEITEIENLVIDLNETLSSNHITDTLRKVLEDALKYYKEDLKERFKTLARNESLLSESRINTKELRERIAELQNVLADDKTELEFVLDHSAPK